MIRPSHLLLLTLTIALAHAQDNIVYDVLGEPLKPGQNYYLIPTSYFNTSGGVKPIPVGSKSCPETFYVSQADNDYDFGNPISFVTRSTSIRLSSVVQIVFPNFPPSYVTCRKGFSNVWGIADYGSAYVVEVSGVNGRSPWFTIEDDKDGNYYLKICVTPRDCDGLSVVTDVYDRPALGVNFTAKPMSFVFETESFFSPRGVKSKPHKQATI